MTNDVETAIWNRATQVEKDPALRDGDRHLAALLLLHGLTMNGGVLHAIEAVTTRELNAACAGFRFFGLGKAAEVFEEASLASVEDDDERERRVDLAYSEHAPEGLIFQRFRTMLADKPALFAPPSP